MSAVFDFSRRAKLRVSGADALRFLNGQLTNDVRQATPERALQASILNAKGKMNAHVFFSGDASSYFLDADEELREIVAARLDRYVIADDVAIEDVTENFSIFHFLAPENAPPETAARTVRANRFGSDGCDFWFERAPEISALSPAEAETFRIERGVPRWGFELSDEIIPVEANLEASAIDYEKGCYIGQETISRMKMSGQTNKRLCGLVALEDVPLTIGLGLTSGSEPPVVVGKITSAARSERLGKNLALGFVKRGHNEIGTLLKVADTNISVRVTALPFI